MVCSACQKVVKKTELATPAVKRKNELYLGSPAGDRCPVSARVSSSGVSKNKLLSKSAKNPYAAYASSCETCKTKTEQGKKYCHRCAYKANACAMCGKSVQAQTSKHVQPVVQAQNFSAK